MTLGSAPSHRIGRDEPFVSDPELKFWGRRTAAFMDFWQRRIPAGLIVPPRSLFQAEDMRDFLSYLLIIDMDENRQRYRNRLIGTEVTLRAGRDATGKWHDEIYSPETLLGHHRGYQWVIEHRRPLRVHGTMGYIGRGYLPVESAVVPVSLDEADQVQQFLVCVAYGEPRQIGL